MKKRANSTSPILRHTDTAEGIERSNEFRRVHGALLCSTVMHRGRPDARMRRWGLPTVLTRHIGIALLIAFPRDK